MTGNNATDSILLPITDGQLNIRAAAGKEGYPFSISALSIEYVSSDSQLPATVWMCGDSTVCNYYPLDTSEQAGWGQVLSAYIDTDVWQVRNMAASGQYAKGFVEAGQFDAIETYGKSGDLYIISIGINDTNYSNADEYYETVTDMVVRAKAKGMTVILVKQQGRSTDVTNNPNLTGRWLKRFAAAVQHLKCGVSLVGTGGCGWILPHLQCFRRWRNILAGLGVWCFGEWHKHWHLVRYKCGCTAI